jgi:MFS family permease
VFLYGNILFRFIKGVGDVWIQTSCKDLIHADLLIGYSVLTLKFPENREKFLGIGEAASGIGLMAGPAMGGFLYSACGFFYAFLSFAGILLVSATLCLFYIP